jgi:hypothetical protein
MQPALWGGLFIGVLSSLPFVSGFNACCCLWVLCGGVLTSYLLQERSATAITPSDGAVGGLVAGAVGAVVTSVLSLAFTLMQGLTPSRAFDEMLEGAGGDVPAEVTAFFEQLRNVPDAVWYIAPLVISLIVFPIFGMLGGLLGAAIFKKTPPPPPPGTVEVLPPVGPGGPDRGQPPGL